jgi:hypothetical protein
MIRNGMKENIFDIFETSLRILVPGVVRNLKAIHPPPLD